MEEWKDIEGYEGYYQVSNKGRVRGLDRKYKRKNPINDGHNYQYQKGCILKDQKIGTGYRAVTLNKNGDVVQVSVHRLVATAFIPNPEDKPCINHKDGDKTNNHVDNLEWCTYKENMIHAYNIGLLSSGEESNKSKLTTEDVLDIRNAYKLGCFTHKELGNAYGVSRQQIGKVINRKEWKHV